VSIRMAAFAPAPHPKAAGPKSFRLQLRPAPSGRLRPSASGSAPPEAPQMPGRLSPPRGFASRHPGPRSLRVRCTPPLPASGAGHPAALIAAVIAAVSRLRDKDRSLRVPRNGTVAAPS